MIKDLLKNSKNYYNLSENLKIGLEWLENNDLKNIKDGKYIINNNVYAGVQTYITKDEAKYESHKKYIDSIDEDIAPITESPLNLEKRTSEEQEIFARKAGFIHNKADVNDYGLLTNEALFWFWINSIKLDYFPFLYK